MLFCLFFFFQAEDGIRDGHVTGVQTCALPISPKVMSGATAAMIAFSLVLTVAAGPIMTYADEAAQSVLERTPYVGAVLDDEAAGDLVYRIDEEGQKVEER